MEILGREDTIWAAPSPVQAGTRNTQLRMWSGREETNTKEVAKPMSSTASDTSHCILQEPVYPVRTNERSGI